MRILIVDDNRDVAEATVLLLSLNGYDVFYASDGESALSLAQRCLPEVVLLDISMPDMNGYEVASRLRREPGIRPREIVAFTSLSGSELDRKAIDEHFDGYFRKPYDVEELVHHLNDMRASGREEVLPGMEDGERQTAARSRQLGAGI